MNADLADQLAAAVRQMQLEPPAGVLPKLAEYCATVWDWNERLNLTRHTTVEQFAARDLVDCLQLSELIEAGQEVLDIGTGGGVPGVVLAILRPDLQVSLCESVGKKAKAVDAIVQQLELPIPVHACRAESLLEEWRYDVLTARAVGPLDKLCRWLAPHWRQFRCLLAVKGPGWVEERGQARHLGWLKDIDLRKVAEYRTPEEEPRTSVILRLSHR